MSMIVWQQLKLFLEMIHNQSILRSCPLLNSWEDNSQGYATAWWITKESLFRFIQMKDTDGSNINDR